MTGRLSPAGKKAALRFVLLLAAAGAVQGLSLLSFLMEGDGQVLFYLFCSYALLPAAAAVVPFWAALGGVHPLAACLPMGGLPLVLGSAPSPLICLVCILVSLVSAVAGQEWKKRKAPQKEGNSNHGRNRGKKQKRA